MRGLYYGIILVVWYYNTHHFINKIYIIVNKHKYIEDEIFRNKLLVVLKVRSMENYCAVIIESDNIIY